MQGEHVPRVEAFLVKKGCVKGVSRINQAAAAPAPTASTKQEKSIARLDKKAAEQKQKQRR